jgi:hypothetical protein
MAESLKAKSMINLRNQRDLIETAPEKEAEVATTKTEGTEGAAGVTPPGITNVLLHPDIDTDMEISIREETMIIRKGTVLIMMFTYFGVEGTEIRIALSPKGGDRPPPVMTLKKESRESKERIREKLKT